MQYARVAGAEGIAVDVSEERLKTAQDLGADHLVDARRSSGTRPEEIQKLGGADAR